MSIIDIRPNHLHFCSQSLPIYILDFENKASLKTLGYLFVHETKGCLSKHPKIDLGVDYLN